MESTGPRATVNASEFTLRLARAVAARVAPEESGVFDEVASAWRAGLAAGRAPGSSVGFGVEAALVSAVVIEVIAASVAQVLAIGAAAAGGRWRRWRTRRRGTGRALAAADVPAVDGRIALTAAQCAQLRDVSRRHAEVLGLSPATAELLADALVGAVHVLDAPPADDRA
jgi:hypothetical protein